MSKASQAAWNTLRGKLKSSPDYVLVRKTSQANVLAGETKVGNDDYATSYFELNVLDLPAGGGSGPAYDDTVIVKDIEDLQTEVDDISAQVDSNTKAIDGFDGGGSCDCDPEAMQDEIDANTAQIGVNTSRIFTQGEDVTANTEQIDKNTEHISEQSGELQALDEELDDKVNISGGQDTLSIWRGTATEYGDLTSVDPNTLYFIIQ